MTNNASFTASRASAAELLADLLRKLETDGHEVWAEGSGISVSGLLIDPPNDTGEEWAVREEDETPETCDEPN